ncbi:hypothetical protein BDAP_002878 [Binucleata daphniae]
MKEEKYEFRIVLPLTVEQYNISQLYVVAQLSKSESTGDTSIKILENVDHEHPEYGKCRKTVKLMNLASRVPGIIRAVLPSKKALRVIETAYNAYPRCNTNYKNEYLDLSKFSMVVDSYHQNGVDFKENIMNLSDEKWNKTKVVYLDICENVKNKQFDPKKVQNGHIDGPGWIERAKEKGIPLMTCYKYVNIKVKGFLLETFSKTVADKMKDLFIEAHQRMYCEMDQWINMSIDDIRVMEEETKKELEKIKDETE